MNNNLIGRTWGSLSNAVKATLLNQANCIDGVTGNNATVGECIVDLTADLSISGTLNAYGEIIIDNDAAIYCPMA